MQLLQPSELQAAVAEALAPLAMEGECLCWGVIGGGGGLGVCVCVCVCVWVVVGGGGE